MLFAHLFPSRLFARFVACAAALASLFALTAVHAQSDALVAAAAREPQAFVTASGLVYRLLHEGNGDTPEAGDTVQVHYRGTFADGREFDSSYKRNQPSVFPLKGVIKCWTEGVQLMKVGGKAKLTCPAALAYGARGAGSAVPPNTTLQFEIELLAITTP